MLGSGSGEVLRYAVFSGILGFIVFCASYASLVWFKRNKKQSSLLSRAGTSLVALGILAAAVTWSSARFAGRDGIVDGNDLFVVRAKRDASVVVKDGDVVAKGDVLAEFRPPEIEAQLAVLDARIEEARSRVGVLGLRSLPIDPVLLQQQNQLPAQVNQQAQIQFELQRDQRDLERKRQEAASSYEKERSQTEGELAETRKMLEIVPAQLELAEKQWGRANELRRRELLAVQGVDDRTSSLLTLRGETAKLETTVATLTKRLVLITEQANGARKILDTQYTKAATQADAATRVLAGLSAKMEIVDGLVETDRERAARMANREIEVADFQLKTLHAEKARALAAVQIRAPFEGRVVYRHASPGFASESMPVLAISKGTGFAAKVIMPRHEINEVADAGQLKFAFEKAVLNRVFVGEYRNAEPLPYDENSVMARFDVKLPIEAIATLTTSHTPVLVHLQWQPSPMANPWFRGGLIVALFGVLVLLLSSLRRSRHPVIERRQNVEVLVERIAEGEASEIRTVPVVNQHHHDTPHDKKVAA